MMIDFRYMEIRRSKIRKRIKDMFEKYIPCIEDKNRSEKFGDIQISVDYNKLNSVHWYGLRLTNNWLHYFTYDEGTLPPTVYDEVARSILYDK